MSTDQPTSPAELAAAIKKSLTEHWRLFLAEGVVLVVLGVAAIIIPPLAGLATTIILGWLFLIGGAVGLVATFGAHQAPGFGWSLLSAIAAASSAGLVGWSVDMAGLPQVNAEDSQRTPAVQELSRPLRMTQIPLTEKKRLNHPCHSYCVQNNS
jgi:hypothetical protein